MEETYCYSYRPCVSQSIVILKNYKKHPEKKEENKTVTVITTLGQIFDSTHFRSDRDRKTVDPVGYKRRAQNQDAFDDWAKTMRLLDFLDENSYFTVISSSIDRKCHFSPTTIWCFFAPSRKFESAEVGKRFGAQ